MAKKTKGSQSSLTDVVTNQFNKHQQGEKTGRRGGNAVSFQTRVTQLREQLSNVMLEKDLSELSLDEAQGTSQYEEARDEVVSAVLTCIDACMVAAHEGASTEALDSIQRVFDLAACLACETGDGSLALAVCNRVIEFSSVVSERVRSQACKLLGACIPFLVASNEILLTTKIPSKSFLSNTEDDTWRNECLEAVEKTLVARLADKSQAVRQAAIESCASFAGCSVSVRDGLIWNMSHDPSVANRIAALASITISEDTLDSVIDRVRDVKVKVRVQALEVLASKQNVKEMTPEQCAELVRFGLTDRCEATWEAATRMISSSWMKAFKFDPVGLIDFVRPTIHETECEKIARAIIDAASDASSASVLSELSNPEIRAFCDGVTRAGAVSVTSDSSDLLSAGQLLFARVKCVRAGSLSVKEQAEVAGKVVPDLPALCDVFNKYLVLLVESLNREEASEIGEEIEAMEDDLCFICMQLLQLARLSDNLKEEGSRRYFINAMNDALSSMDTPDDLLEGVILAMACATESESYFLQKMSEILADLSESSESEEEDQEILPSRHLRIVSILAIVLERTSSKMASNPILTSFAGYILSAVTSRDAMVREAGVSCMGKYALLSEEEVVKAEIKPLLLEVAANESEKIEIRGQATLAFCDLSLLFSGMLVEANDDDSSTSFAGIIGDMMHHDKPAVVAVAAEVASKLLFAGKLNDPSLVAGLLLIFFHPDLCALASTCDEEMDEVAEVGSLVRLQQLLTLFFPSYSMKSRQGRETLVNSVETLLELVNKYQSRKVKKRKSRTWPIAKMIEYIGSTVEMGRQHAQSEEQSASVSSPNDDDSNLNEFSGVRVAKYFDGDLCFGTVLEVKPGADRAKVWQVKFDDGREADIGEGELNLLMELHADEKQHDRDGLDDEVSQEGTLDSQDDETVISIVTESSYSASILCAVANFLSSESNNLSLTYLRALCKVLGSTHVDFDTAEPSYLSLLKRGVDELSMLLSDATALRAIGKLQDTLDEVESADEEELSEDEDESLAEALEAVDLNESEGLEHDDKENKVDESRSVDKSAHYPTPSLAAGPLDPVDDE